MLLKDVVKEVIRKGKIVFLSSHQMNYIEEFCDSIAIINGGQVVLEGDLRDIKRNYPRNRLVVRSLQNEKIAREYKGRFEWGENGEIIIILDTLEDKKRVMSELTETYDIDELKVYEPSLNDIFVEYAENQI